MEPAVFGALQSRLAALYKCFAEGSDRFDRWWASGEVLEVFQGGLGHPQSRPSGSVSEPSTIRLWWTYSARTRPKCRELSARLLPLLLPPQCLLLCCRPHSSPPRPSRPPPPSPSHGRSAPALRCRQGRSAPALRCRRGPAPALRCRRGPAPAHR